MDATRHRLADEAILLNRTEKLLLDQAEQLEINGNWYLAGEVYRKIDKQLSETINPETRAQLLIRAATCFEITGQHRPAARAYFDAASCLSNNQLRIQIAGELYNRAASLFKALGEFFNAGDSWHRAGKAFTDVPDAIVTSPNNILAVPYSAGKFTVAGNCYSAGGDAFSLTGDNARWSCMAYWESAHAHSQQGNWHPAFVAYRKALTACIRFYGTHDRETLRRCLPLTEEERKTKLDPLQAMEDAAFKGNSEHQSMNSASISPEWIKINTNRQIAAAYHEFYLVFLQIENIREASQYRALEKERMRQIHLAERHYRAALLYWIWSVSSGYGESLARWGSVCISVLLLFSVIYRLFKLIEPVNHWFDYIYFSIVTFTSLGYGDIHPVGFWGKLIACTEITFGLIMFGIVLTLIGNRLQRT